MRAVLALTVALVISLIVPATASAHDSPYCGHSSDGIYTRADFLYQWTDYYGVHRHSYRHSTPFSSHHDVKTCGKHSFTTLTHTHSYTGHDRSNFLAPTQEHIRSYTNRAGRHVHIYKHYTLNYTNHYYHQVI